MARKRSETATEPLKEIKARRNFTRAKKCMKTTTKKFHECGKHNSGIEKSHPKSSADSPSSQDQRWIQTEDQAQEVPVLDLHPGKDVQPSGKLKLQLFPLDAHTREGLEKDGFHPYLELTLSSRKKISSVRHHIHSKWGSSEIARGDPTLCPYDKTLLASGHKLIANSNMTTGDFYKAIGAPSIFRLRYGWSSETVNKTNESTSPSTLGIACFQNNETHNIIGSNTESASFTGKQMFGLDNPLITPSSANEVIDPPPLENLPSDGKVESKENKINDGSGPTFFSWEDGLTNLSTGGLLSEVSLQGKFGNNCKTSNTGNARTTLWDDNLTNISIGGLFSEESLQDRLNTNHEQEPAHDDQPSGSIGASSLGEIRLSDCSKTWERRRDMTQQSLPLISDSLDAFLVNRTDQPRAPCTAPSPRPSHSSILDAEDTCHAFSFQKGTATSQNGHEQVSGEAEKQKDESKQSKTLFSSMVFNQESSLGFSGIKWADSRGPFDFGLSTHPK